MAQQEINEEGLALLRERFTEVMPLLNKNLSVTYDMYMNSEIPNGAYQHTLARHSNALAITSPDVKLNPLSAFQAGAFLFLDLKNGMDDLTDQAEKTDYAEKIEKLKILYQEQGFTAQNPLFKVPMQPVEGLDL